jgi:hypothetical protein
MKQYSHCRIRRDLIKQGLSIPIGLKPRQGMGQAAPAYFTGNGKRWFRCRWFDDFGLERFQIYFRSKWRSALSIDFEFSKTTLHPVKR